jgi:general secretion pathway protein G
MVTSTQSAATLSSSRRTASPSDVGIHDPIPQPTTDNPQPATCSASGFTLLELLIVMAIIATLAAMAIPAYTRNVQAAKEAVLREDLQVMRTAIGSYTVDKQKSPQGLEDIVSAGYLKAIPVDPMTKRSDTWTLSQSDALGSVDQTDAGGVDDVHSGAQINGIDGTSYNTW